MTVTKLTDAVIVDRVHFALRDAIRHLPECGYDLTFSDFFPAVRSFPVLRTFRTVIRHGVHSDRTDPVYNSTENEFREPFEKQLENYS